ncbi:MAG: hypothetical protein GW913_03745 [Myxococcales bacterium]|nr:hypothetical protein [Myxococcales bacterium]
MGTGTVAFYWYGSCLCFLAFTGLVTMGLFAWGKRDERKAAEAKKSAAALPEDPA